jgi:hypothetical protein
VPAPSEGVASKREYRFAFVVGDTGTDTATVKKVDIVSGVEKVTRIGLSPPATALDSFSQLPINI